MQAAEQTPVGICGELSPWRARQSFLRGQGGRVTKSFLRRQGGKGDKIPPQRGSPRAGVGIREVTLEMTLQSLHRALQGTWSSEVCSSSQHFPGGGLGMARQASSIPSHPIPCRPFPQHRAGLLPAVSPPRSPKQASPGTGWCRRARRMTQSIAMETGSQGKEPGMLLAHPGSMDRSRSICWGSAGRGQTFLAANTPWHHWQG